MLPVRIWLSSSASPSVGYAALKAEYTNLRWITTLLIVAAVAIPCTFFFHAATPSVSFLLSFQGEPRPRPIKTTWAAAAAATRKTRRNSESELPASSLKEKIEISSSVPITKAGNSRSLPPVPDELSNDVPANDVSAKPEISMNIPASSNISTGVLAEPPTLTASSFGELENEDARLEKVLKAAAMDNKTVIITTSNAAWAAPGSIMDLFLESFHNGNGTEELLQHVVIVALDPEAYGRCKSVHPHCFALTTEGVDFSAEKSYMSDGYLQLVWRKLDILRLVLRKGYDFIFTDADVMWLRNPLPEFFPEADFQSSCDKYVGDPSDLENEPNTGFKYVKANNRTMAFYNYWYDSRLKYPGQGQQVVFNGIKHDPYVRQVGISIKFLSDQVFGGLCVPPKQVVGVCTMHTTCCIGLASKVHDLEILRGDWRMYTSLPVPFREERSYKWSELQFTCRGIPLYKRKTSPSPSSQPDQPIGRVGAAVAPN